MPRNPGTEQQTRPPQTPTPATRCVCGDPWPCDLHADPNMLVRRDTEDGDE